jgi:CheY-like chemotaxis protein
MTSSDAHEALKGARVLVVEDAWQVAIGLKQLLEAWEADVAGPVSTSAAAERLISQRIPDVAVVDIHLRKGDKSCDLIDRLHDRGIRIVVITGYSDVSVTAGKVVAVLLKPFDEESLLEALLPSRTEYGDCVRDSLSLLVVHVCSRGISILQLTPFGVKTRSTPPPSS